MAKAWHGRFKTEVQEDKRLSIRLLGPPEVSFGERPLRFRVKKALALLCYLAAEGGRHSRRELAELLWPQSEERRARTDLRSALAKLRKTLGQDSTHGEEEARLLLIDGDLLGVEPKEVELDLEALEAAVSLARRETSSAGGSSDDYDVGRRKLIGRLQGDLGVYRGEFMEGFWVEDAPSSSCGWRLSVRGGALFSGSYARGSHGLKGRRD